MPHWKKPISFTQMTNGTYTIGGYTISKIVRNDKNIEYFNRHGKLLFEEDTTLKNTYKSNANLNYSLELNNRVLDCLDYISQDNHTFIFSDTGLFDFYHDSLIHSNKWFFHISLRISGFLIDRWRMYGEINRENNVITINAQDIAKTTIDKPHATITQYPDAIYCDFLISEHWHARVCLESKKYHKFLHLFQSDYRYFLLACAREHQSVVSWYRGE